MRSTFIVILLSIMGGRHRSQLLYVVPDGVETRWASPENPSGERGKGAPSMADARDRHSSS